MNPTQSGLLYLLAGVLFIFTLRGLSAPSSSNWGNLFGMIGMVLAIATTIFIIPDINIIVAASAILAGGAIGTFIAWRLQMTALPQLVAFHSLVGLAAVFVALAAFYAPEYYGIAVKIVTGHREVFIVKGPYYEPQYALMIKDLEFDRIGPWPGDWRHHLFRFASGFW